MTPESPNLNSDIFSKNEIEEVVKPLVDGQGNKYALSHNDDLAITGHS